MAPDFHYFIFFAPSAASTHSFKGTFLFSLPAGLIVLWVFHNLLKLPMVSLLPERHARKLVAAARPFALMPMRRLLLICASLLAGIFSHLLWDSFTHRRGWVVQQFPALQNVVWHSFGSPRPIYNVLQNASAVAGLAVLAIFYWRWFSRAPAQPIPAALKINPEIKRWTIGAMAVTVPVLSLVYAVHRCGGICSRSVFVSHIAVSFITIAFLELAGFSFYWRGVQPRQDDLA